MAARSTVMESNAFQDEKSDALKLEKAERRGRNQCLDVRDEQQQQQQQFFIIRQHAFKWIYNLQKTTIKRVLRVDL